MARTLPLHRRAFGAMATLAVALGLAAAILLPARADTKISAFASLTSPAANDLLPIVDVNDATMGPSGTDKNITVSNFLGAPSNGNLVGWEGKPVPILVGGGLSLTGTGPYTLAATGGSGSGTVNSGTSGQLAYYASAGTAVSGSSLTSLIDAIGSTQGSVLYRGASGWSALAPGTSGQVLTSGGAAANPSWTSVGGTGTVTTVSVASANGFAGTVATATSTPAITLSTSITGILKGNGTAIGAATAGTDYLAPNGNGSSLTGITASQVGLGSVTNAAQTLASVVPNTAPAAGQVLVGNAGGTAYAPAAVSGDATLASTGALTVSKTGGVAFAASATTDTTSASNISSGTLNAARLPGSAVQSITLNTSGTLHPTPVNFTVTAGAATGSLSLSTQSANTVFAGPTTGSAAAPTFRAIAAADLPTTGLTITQHTGTIGTVAASAGAATVNLAANDWWIVNLSSAASTTLTFAAPAVGQQFTLALLQDATGSNLVTWPGGIRWAGGSAPTLTTTASKYDVVTIKCISSGVYLGFLAGQGL